VDVAGEQGQRGVGQMVVHEPPVLGLGARVHFSL
jgi:hypothetical protein